MAGLTPAELALVDEMGGSPLPVTRRQVEPVPDVSRIGLCRCGVTGRLRTDGRCEKCWAADNDADRPPEESPAWGSSRAAAVDFVEACLKREASKDQRQSNQPPYRHPVLKAYPGMYLRNHYEHPTRAARPAWQLRPWHRYRWQVTDAALPRAMRSRTAPARMDVVACLVCLQHVELRADQVCSSCDRSWRSAGHPWDERYDAWLRRRRADPRPLDSRRCRSAGVPRQARPARWDNGSTQGRGLRSRRSAQHLKSS